MWQDLVFLAGSVFSVFSLAPTLRDATARVPLATSFPSMAIGGIYALTFISLGMTFSAVGSTAACTMWALIAMFRSPSDGLVLSRREKIALFVTDVRNWGYRSVRTAPIEDQYLLAE